MIPEGVASYLLKPCRYATDGFFINFTLKQALGSFTKKAMRKCTALIILAERGGLRAQKRVIPKTRILDQL